ncbi:MAG: hypothetical protein ACKOH7_01235 [Solirubrobacterales bacterium]
MSTLGWIGVMLGTVFVVNLMPAFGPPTWTVLVFFRIKYDVPAVPLVLGGAAAAACGRFVLASVFRRIGWRLPEGKRRDLEAVGEALTERRASRWGTFALFLVSPFPSTQLFEAAGLTPQVNLRAVTLAFFLGRLVTYSIYVGGATLAKSTISSVLDEGFRSPWAIALQVLLLALLAAFVLIPWAKILRRPGG